MSKTTLSVITTTMALTAGLAFVVANPTASAATTPTTTSKQKQTKPKQAKPKRAASTTVQKNSDGAAVDPNAPEVVSPGDIPDNQAFVAYVSATGFYSIKVPEGWTRTENADVVTFTDKFNSIGVKSENRATAPTIDSIQSSGLTDVESDPTFKLGSVTKVKTGGGVAIRVTYEIGSAPNRVTKQSALLAVERYVYFANGHQVVVTLSGAKGADNVDPWKIVTDSVRVK